MSIYAFSFVNHHNRKSNVRSFPEDKCPHNLLEDHKGLSKVKKGTKNSTKGQFLRKQREGMPLKYF